MSFNMIEIAKLYNGNANDYMLNRVRDLRSNGVLIDNEDKVRIEILYKKIVFEVVNYLRTVLPDGFVDTDGTYNLDYKSMMENLSPEARWFLEVPSINTSLAPFGEDHSAIMYFKDNCVFKSTDVHKAKGLPFRYKREKFNEYFIGKNIYEVRNILRSLGVLTYNNDLDPAIIEMETKYENRQNYLNSVIAKLLLSGEEEDVVRAFLFDQFTHAHFNFSEYSLEESYSKAK